MRSSATEVALCGVTATVLHSSNGTREKSWMESTAPEAVMEATGTSASASRVPREGDARDGRDVEPPVEQRRG